jgi:hypothetical protein
LTSASREKERGRQWWYQHQQLAQKSKHLDIIHIQLPKHWQIIENNSGLKQFFALCIVQQKFIQRMDRHLQGVA